MKRTMKRGVGILVILGLMGAAGAIAGGAVGDAPIPVRCAEGYTSWEAFEGMYAGSAASPPSLDRAIQLQLREVPVDVSASSVEGAVFSTSGGTIEVRMVDVDRQPVELRLQRHQGGYIDAGAAWCAPTAES